MRTRRKAASLIEVLVAASIGLIVLGVLFMIMGSVGRMSRAGDRRPAVGTECAMHVRLAPLAAVAVLLLAPARAGWCETTCPALVAVPVAGSVRVLLGARRVHEAPSQVAVSPPRAITARRPARRSNSVRPMP